MKVNNPEVVVLSGVRTAIGTYGGSLKNHAPTDLAGTVVREAMARADINPERVGHCVFGHVVDSDPSDMYMGRVAAMKGGMSEKPHLVSSV